MVQYDKDVRLIKAVGLIITGLGLLLMLFALATAGLAVISVQSSSPQAYTLRPLAALLLAVIMSLSMIACGAQLARPDPLVATQIESLRLVWAALFGMMVITWLAGFALRPELGGLSLIVLLLLLMIRGAMVRISYL